MYLVINKWVTAVKVSNFSGHYLRNSSTLDIGVLGYIGIVQHKEHSPEVLSIPPGTSRIPDDVLIQLILLMMSTGLLETLEKWNKHIKKCVKLVINMNSAKLFRTRRHLKRFSLFKVEVRQKFLTSNIFDALSKNTPTPHTTR